jgi:hypothetical protein
LGLYEYLKLALKFLFYVSSMKKNVRLMNSIFEFDFEMKGSKPIAKKLLDQGNRKVPYPHKFHNQKQRGNFELNLNEISKSPDISKNYNNKSKIELNTKEMDIGVRGLNPEKREILKNTNSTIRNNEDQSISNVHLDNPVSSNHSQKQENFDLHFLKKRPMYVMARVKVSRNENNDYFKIRNRLEIRNNIKFSNSEILFLNFCRFCIKNKRLKRKNDLFQMGEEKLEEMFEVFYLMKKFEEVEKLKTIMMNKQQLALFNLSSQEMISPYSENLNNCEFSKLKEFQSNPEKMNDEIDRFKDTLNDDEESLDAVDRRLFNHLPLEIKEIIIKKKN